ncbi:MAG: methyltransferase domain-containing protein [Candidatus Zambryskibacteria bacterium]|nr:methyltransferase domain-containing protein [Candidatus Zambryskibacteria bacterium]
MCHVSCIIFGAKSLSKEEIAGKEVLEAGSYDVNGTLRPLLESYGPKEYVGTDIMHGPGVDIVCDAEDLVKHFGDKKFDVIVSTEMLEHAKDWQQVISNLKNVAKPGAIFLLTTRSYGFAYHAYPHDYWRYEKEDMENIFSDMEILDIEKDKMAPDIFLKLRKPKNFKERKLGDYNLYSIVTDTKITHVSDGDYKNPYFHKLRIKMQVNHLIYKVENTLKSLIKFLISSGNKADSLS